MQTTTYKQTPIGLIPSDWEVKKFDKATKLITCGLAATPIYVDAEFGMPFFSAQNVQNCKVIFDNFKYIPLELYRQITKNSKPEKGDILYTRVGAGIGEAGIIDIDFEFGIYVSLTLIKLNKEILNNYFLLNILNSDYYRKLAKRDQFAGGGVQNLNVQVVKEFNIPIPPLPEQQKIATILSTWDAAIDKCKEIIEKLKMRNKGLAQQLLSGNFKQKKLSEIFERVTTKNTEGNQNVITISAQRGFVMQTDFFNKVIASDILDNYFLVQKGDFCYNKSYSNGYDWGATKRLNDLDKAVVTTLYICFRLKDESKNSGDFFEYYFESGILNEGLSKVANEGGRAHGLLNVTPTDFFNIKVGIPTLEEQIKIAKILFTASSELNQYQQKLQILQQQKKGLMQQLLTGKTRVKI